MMATALAIAITAPFAGALADVLGRKRVIVAAMLVLAIPTALLATAPSLHALIGWRFAQGLVLPPVFTVVVAYIGEEWPPAEATGVTGLYMAATSVGGFCGRFFSGLLADTVGWRNGFLAIAAVTFACGLAVAAILPRERNFVRSEGVFASTRQMLGHLRNPRLLAIYAVGFGTLFNFVALFTYVVFVLAAPPFNLPPTALGAIFVTYLAGSVVVLGLGRAVARFGRRTLDHRHHRGVGVRRADDARAFIVGDHRRARDRGRMRLHHPGNVDRLGRADGAERPDLRDRAVRHVLLCRRRLRRGPARADLEHRRLAGLRRDGDRHAGFHGNGRRPRVAALTRMSRKSGNRFCDEGHAQT